MRRWQFISLWAITVFFVYQPRRVACPRCGARVEPAASCAFAFAFDAGKHYEVPDTRSTEKWTKTDPEIHKDLARDKHAAYSNEWKGLVRMVKTWNRHKQRPVKPSFLLEVMALELFDGGFGGDYRYELKGFFSSAADRIFDAWPDPARLGPDVSMRMNDAEKQAAKAALQSASHQCLRAIQTERAGRIGDALRIWHELFGARFAMS